jgi:hypothetical protein
LQNEHETELGFYRSKISSTIAATVELLLDMKRAVLVVHAGEFLWGLKQFKDNF